MKKDTALEIIYNEVKSKFEDTLKEKESLDSKAISLLGFTGVIISVCFVLFLFAIDKLQNESFFGVFVILFLHIIFLLFLSVLCSLLNIRLREYDVGPKVDAICKDISQNKEEVLNELLERYRSDFEHNRKQNDSKVKLFEYAFYLTVTGIVLLSIPLIISLIILIAMML